MATTFWTLTGDVGDLVGAPFTQPVRVRIEADAPVIVDLTTNHVQLGMVDVPVDAAGSFSQVLIASNSGAGSIYPAAIQYRVHIDHPVPARRTNRWRRVTWTSDWFNLTAAADLSDLVA